jgi:hypothetical protein
VQGDGTARERGQPGDDLDDGVAGLGKSLVNPSVLGGDGFCAPADQGSPRTPEVTMNEVLLSGLKIGESARWHDGRLWLSHWGAAEVLAVDVAGNTEVMARVPTTIPFSIDWLSGGIC